MKALEEAPEKRDPNQISIEKTSLWHILVYNFSVTHPKLMKFGDFSFYLRLTFLIFFLEIGAFFGSVSTFSRPGVISCSRPLLE